jgi:hypothetical protein
VSPKAIRANQEFFDLLAGDIFARLYTFFPEPIDLYSDGVLPHLGLQQDEVGEDPQRLKILYGHVVGWLAAEGYIRIGQIAPGDDDEEVFTDVVLTSKGLEALRKTPGSLTGPGATLGGGNG